jgi:non-heme chloroperoxidase
MAGLKPGEDRGISRTDGCLAPAGRVMSARPGLPATALTKNMPICPRRDAILLLVILLLGATASFARIEASSGNFVSSDGVRLHYLDTGLAPEQGPIVIFVPGWTMPAEIWEPQIQHFAKSHRVIAFDPRGQGKSEIARDGYTIERRARDLAELIEQLDQPVVLVGWSLGVLESLAYVESAGTQRVRALVLVDNSIGEEPPPTSDPTFLPRLKQNRIATTERFVRNMFRTPQKEPYLRKIVASSLRVPTDAAVALLSYPYPRERWKQIVYATDRPILYAITARFSGQAENLKKKHPQARIEVFENAGHALFVDEAERFNRVLEEFLNQQVGADSKRGKNP